MCCMSKRDQTSLQRRFPGRSAGLTDVTMDSFHWNISCWGSLCVSWVFCNRDTVAGRRCWLFYLSRFNTTNNILFTSTVLRLRHKYNNNTKMISMKRCGCSRCFQSEGSHASLLRLAEWRQQLSPSLDSPEPWVKSSWYCLFGKESGKILDIRGLWNGSKQKISSTTVNSNTVHLLSLY